MEISQQILQDKIETYLSGSISQDEIYQWALSVAVSDEYENVRKDDILLVQTIQALLDIHKAEKNPKEFEKRLQYHCQCLKGEEEFVPQKIEEISPELNEPTTDFFVIIRIYIIVFAVCSIILNLFSLVHPRFLQFGEEAATYSGALRDAIPHLLYALVLLIPLRIAAKNLLFFPVSLILCFGALFYWYIPMSMVNKFSLSPVFILIVLPFSAMPATLALLQLMATKDRLKKK